MDENVFLSDNVFVSHVLQQRQFSKTRHIQSFVWLEFVTDLLQCKELLFDPFFFTVGIDVSLVKRVLQCTLFDNCKGSFTQFLDMSVGKVVTFVLVDRTHCSIELLLV